MQDRKTAAPDLTLIVPVFNEEETIGLFVETVDAVVVEAGLSATYLFVNDGSRDGTAEILLGLQRARGDVLVINLSRNFGKEAALTAGLDHAPGDAVVILDVDLQDPPELIPDFVEAWRQGYDNVYGLRVDRSSDTRGKQMTASAFYALFNRFARDPIPANAGDFRLLDRKVVEALRRMPERNRFMKGMFAWVGYATTAVPFERPERSAGKTKYNYFQLWNFALDGFVSFTTAPLKMWMYVGFAVALISLIYAAYVAARVLVYGVDVPGYASIMVVNLFLGSLILISLGMLGEYIGRLFLEAKERPVYLIGSAFGRFPAPDAEAGAPPPSDSPHREAIGDQTPPADS